jgi:tetratricopeptide (TPR) repeat protein
MAIKLMLLCCGALVTAACQNPQSPAGRSPDQQAELTEFDDAQNRPPSGKTLYAAARLLRATGRRMEYEAALLRIIREQPECMPAYCDMARLRLEQGNVAGAIDVLSAGLRVRPANPVLLNDLGMCRLEDGDYEQALVDFTRATSIAPDNKRYRANMATALGMLGRYEESLALYEQVVSHDMATHNLAILRDVRRRQPLRE